MLTFMREIIEQNQSILAVVAAVFAFYKWQVSQNQKETGMISEMLKIIRDDKIYRLIQMLDYDKKWYNKNFHGQSIEIDMDKLLVVCSYACHLREKRMISKKAFEFFKYDLGVILSNWQIHCYFYNLNMYCKKTHSDFPFAPLLRYGLKMEFIDKGFLEDAESRRRYNIPDYLNSYIEEKKYSYEKPRCALDTLRKTKYENVMT